ncbi:MAG: nucleotidyltransferase domain-containing protein [bacterium]
MGSKMKDATNQILGDLKIRLTDLYQDRLDRICLFGSRARGTADADSDIDVLVVLTGIVDPNRERVRSLDIVSELSLDHDVVISCLFADSKTYATQQGPLYRTIRREGVTL